MKEGRGKSILLVAVGWIVIVFLVAAAYRFFVRPRSEEQLADETGTKSRYRHQLTIAADSFSGYSLLRSESLASQLGNSSIQLVIKQDDADYVKRMKALRDRDIELAVFTIDSFITAGAAIRDYPASIVLVLDETKGADAIIAYSTGVGQIADLDHRDGRIVATPASPSEFLARTVIAHFSLPNLPDDWLIEANGASDVYRQFRSADRKDRRAYVLWEPYVSKALREPNAKVLLDSSKLQGFIVDVLVAERTFLRDHPEMVETFVQAYLSASYAKAREPGAMRALVIEDAQKTGGERISDEQAQRLVDGIRWKNTLENYAHFGLVDQGTTGGLRHIEDMIRSISSVLEKTGVLRDGEVEDKAHTFFYDRILRALQEGDFHPAKSLSLISDTDLGTGDLEEVRVNAALAQLSENQWSRLVKVGEMRVEPISFARGTARINVQSRRELAALVDRLMAWPHYYLEVVGHARAIGDADANRTLAEARAKAAAEVLIAKGIHKHRIHTQAVPLTGRGGAAQSVSFLVVQLPY